jgi:hypothetical protein
MNMAISRYQARESPIQKVMADIACVATRQVLSGEIAKRRNLIFRCALFDRAAPHRSSLQKKYLRRCENS